MPIAPANDPVIAELNKRGTPLTQENYQKMNTAMRGAGWGGGHAPTGNIKPMTLSGQMPEELQYGADQQEPPIEEGSAEDQYGKELEEANAYADQLAGDGKDTAAPKAKKQVASTASPANSEGMKTETPDAEVAAAPAAQEEGSGWIGEAIASLIGAGGAAALAKKFLGTDAPPPQGMPGEQKLLSGPKEGDVIYAGAPEDQPKLPRPGAYATNNLHEAQRQFDEKGTEFNMSKTAEGEPFAKPKVRVPANQRKVEAASAEEEPFDRTKAGYDKARAEGRVGRPKGKGKARAQAALAARRLAQ